MHTAVNNTKLRILCLALAVVFAGLVPATWAQRGPLVEFAETPSPNRDQRSAKARMMASAMAFLESPRSGIWAGPADTFKNVAATLDPSGRLVGRYERYHMGLNLLDASVKVVVGPDGEASFTYTPTPFVAPANVIPAVPEDRVWSIVAGELRVGTKGLYGEIELALEPKEQGEAALVWYVRASHPQADATDFTIDALTGDVISREQGYAEESVNVTGTGTMRPKSTDGAGVEVEIDTLWHNHDGEYFLVDHSRGGSKVLDMQDQVETSDFYGHTYRQMASNEWGDGLDWKEGDSTTGPTGQTAAVEALWGAQRTWDMLLNTLNLEGYDGNAEPMILRVHIRKKENELYGDAHWDGDYANFGSGKESDSWSRTDLNTVAHELGHGVWARNVSRRNKGEARGLNEGHGDITGALASHYAHLAQGAGPHIPSNERGNMEHFDQRMINPWSYHVDGQQGLAAYTAGMEHKEEHTQGTAYGHMFAILSAGMPTQPETDASPCIDKSYTCLHKASFPLGLNGIGMDKAARIWILATVKYFDSKPTFHEARQAWLDAAAELFGNPSPEYAAVQNAFYIINVGDPAEDLFPPELETRPLIVDNFEGSVLVEASGVDDIGVVMIDANITGDWKKAFGDRFKGYLDAPTLPGSYEATVRAWDANLSFSQANLPFDYTSSNRLFLSPFESTFLAENDPADENDDQWYASGWLTAIGEMIRSDDPEGAFLGDGYISFANNRWIERDVVIPAEATQVQLGYRYRVKGGMALGSGQLRVEILDDQGDLLETLTVITPGKDTTQAFSNHYLKNTHTLSEAYAGQQLRVRFRSIDSTSDLFRIDQAFMVYDANPVVDLDVEVDEREGSVIIEADVSGVSQALVDYVKFFVDGIEIAQVNYWPYQLIWATDNFALDVVLSAEAIAYDHFDDPIAASGTEDFEVETIPLVLYNGDFENSDLYWDVDGDVAFCTHNPASGQAHPAFIGTGCMTFSGTGSLSRTVWIPASALTGSISFRLKNNTVHMTGVELIVKVIDNDTGLVIGTLDEISGSVANTDFGTTHKGYRKYVADLTPYKGMDFSVMFDLQGNGEPLEFHIDNVGATYFTFGGGPGGGGPGGLGGN